MKTSRQFFSDDTYMYQFLYTFFFIFNGGVQIIPKSGQVGAYTVRIHVKL